MIPRMVHPFKRSPGPWVRGEDRRSRTKTWRTRNAASPSGAGRIARPVAAPASVGQPASTGTQPAGQRDHERRRASTKRHIAWLDDEIARVDEEYKKALQSSSELSRRAALYQSVQGVGILTAAILAADLPELGEGDKPLWWAWLPGPVTAYRAIRGGRGQYVDMAPLSLIRSKNSALARFKPVKKRGKPGKVARGSDEETTFAARHSSAGNPLGRKTTPQPAENS